MKSNNQGKDTDTVLTNLSKYIKVVSNEPYCQRKHQRYGLPSLRKLSEERGRRRNVRGLSPLHQTTLVFETLPVDRKVLSTMKEVCKENKANLSVYICLRSKNVNNIHVKHK